MAEGRLGPSSFEATLNAAQAGGGWAFERLWTSLAAKVSGYLASQGCADSDDLTNEVFLGVFRNIEGFSGDEDAFRSWTFTIAHRRLQDYRRHVARRPPAIEFRTDSAYEPAAPAAEADALQRLATERVARLCERLVPDQRDVLLLRLVAGLTVAEVTAVTGKSQGATKSLQRRGLLALQKILEAEGVPL